jgi:hypothetical protein
MSVRRHLSNNAITKTWKFRSSLPKQQSIIWIRQYTDCHKIKNCIMQWCHFIYFKSNEELQFWNSSATKYEFHKGFNKYVPTDSDHLPPQADPKVQPFASELFSCSIWPSHGYSAKNKTERVRIITLYVNVSACNGIYWHNKRCL